MARKHANTKEKELAGAIRVLEDLLSNDAKLRLAPLAREVVEQGALELKHQLFQLISKKYYDESNTSSSADSAKG